MNGWWPLLPQLGRLWPILSCATTVYWNCGVDHRLKSSGNNGIILFIFIIEAFSLFPSFVEPSGFTQLAMIEMECNNNAQRTNKTHAFSPPSQSDYELLRRINIGEMALFLLAMSDVRCAAIFIFRSVIV